MRLLAKTLFGLEPVLANEIETLGGADIQILNRAVEFEGDFELMYNANLWCRTALRILRPIATFQAHNERHLYSQAQKFDWSQILEPNSTFAIDSTTYSERFTHSHFAALKLKDAIADQFNDNHGVRPSVNLEAPDVLINLHISDTEVSLSMDSSGGTLEKRGYRTEANDAPMSEVLAAGIVLLSGWDGKSTLINPMTGSGTIAIEAATRADNIAPGLNRNFGFQTWLDYDDNLFQELKSKAESKRSKTVSVILASDINAESIAMAKRNAQRADVGRQIEFSIEDFNRSKPLTDSAMMIMNPPYGQRMEDASAMKQFYHKIGFQLKHEYANHTAWVFSGNLAAMKMLGLKPEQRIKLYNGPLECRFNEYRLFKGKRAEQVAE